MLTRVALVSFGDREEWYAQAHLAILTALASLPPPCEVVVTTDRPDWYVWFGDRVRLVRLTPEQIVDWSGPHRFVWRVVLKALTEMSFLEPAANLLYLDVDTLVRRPLGDLIALAESGDVFLDRFEAPLHHRAPRGALKVSALLGRGSGPRSRAAGRLVRLARYTPDALLRLGGRIASPPRG